MKRTRHNVILFSSMPTPLNVGMKLKVKTIVCYYNNYYVSIKLTHQEFTDTFRAVAILKGKKANPFLFTKKALPYDVRRCYVWLAHVHTVGFPPNRSLMFPIIRQSKRVHKRQAANMRKRTVLNSLPINKKYLWKNLFVV